MGIQYINLNSPKQKQLLKVNVKNAEPEVKTTAKKQRKSNKK